MSHDAAAQLMVELAGDFISLVRAIDHDWKVGYLRFSRFDLVAEIKASFQTDKKVDLIDVRKYRSFFNSAIEQGQKILFALGQEEGVSLLVVNCNFDYEFMFEHKDRTRWSISKLNGGTGTPSGI